MDFKSYFAHSLTLNVLVFRNFQSEFEYQVAGFGDDGSIVYDEPIFTTAAAAMEHKDTCVSRQQSFKSTARYFKNVTLQECKDNGYLTRSVMGNTVGYVWHKAMMVRIIRDSVTYQDCDTFSVVGSKTAVDGIVMALNELL